jgi:hypothetical protein
MQMQTEVYRARVLSDDRGNFSRVRHSNVLIYFPHGFGDWVQLGYVLPLLEPSNRYWITRFGDDNTSVIKDHAKLAPVYLGVNSTHCSDGEVFGVRHFGIVHDEINGEERDLRLPRSLYDACVRNRIEVVLWPGFPETGGLVQYPYHSKARNLLSYLVEPGRLSGLRLDRPLRSSISFAADPYVTNWVESRLTTFAGFGERRMCIIGRNGYTAVGKNWGHLWREDLPGGAGREGDECREFMRLMLRKDPRWMFLVVEDRLFEGDDTLRSRELHAFSYAELFGTPDTSGLPFGLVMKVLANLADLCIGVPAGPYHLCMAKSSLPTIGLWIEHLPSWFDEPKSDSLHLVSRNVHDRALDQRVGSFSTKGQLGFELIWLDTRIVTGERVIGAVEELL